MELSEIVEKSRTAINNIETVGTEYAKAKALSWQLQELRKVVLAEQMRKMEPNLSVAERDSRARVSEEYVTHLKGTKEAIEKELTLKAQYTRWVSQYETCRSLLSVYKAQTRIL